MCTERKATGLFVLTSFRCDNDGDALVGFGMVLGGYGCFNRPHDGYANRSNSKTSLPTVSRTVLPRAVG